ncbi:DMT family transporter [Uliginosibacterium paludis]|uniref:DMT family transporter n=1 Tax=Uliginosibacterium paludis TaxID=1615952 RepID=A0ABV2CSU9_9RHOO
MNERRTLDAPASALMLVLCLIWALQQIVLKATAHEITPLLQIALRSGLSALLIACFMRRHGGLRLTPGVWRSGLLSGVLFAVEFLFVGAGLQLTSAAHMVVLLYTAPIFVALGLHRLIPAERLAPLQWGGIGLAFGGIVLSFFGPGPASAAPDATMLAGDVLGLLAGLAWAATTLMVRCSPLATVPASEALLYQLAAGFVLLLPASLLSGQAHFQPGPAGWLSLAFQSVIVSFASYLLWFRLLGRYLASSLGSFSFLTPLFGVLLGALWLGEALEPRFIAGSALVLAGVLTVSRHHRRPAS